MMLINKLCSVYPNVICNDLILKYYSGYGGCACTLFPGYVYGLQCFHRSFSWIFGKAEQSREENGKQMKQEISANAHETRESLQQFRFSSVSENTGVHAKLIYKYQILYLDRITIVPWRHLVNDIDLRCSL